MQSHLYDRVLVLDCMNVLMGTTSVRGVFVSIFRDEMDVLEYRHGVYVRSSHRLHRVPEVVRWREPVRFIMYRSLGPTRRNILLRDENICAYCGGYGHTRDHILPKSRGGIRSWENLVTACEECNMKKGSRTPEEAGMPLIYAPRKPNTITMIIKRPEKAPIPKSWKRYLEPVELLIA